MLRQHRPALHAAALRIASAWDSPERQRVLAQEYQGMEKVSVDYAVMQEAAKAGKVLVLERRSAGTTWAAGWRWSG